LILSGRLFSYIYVKRLFVTTVLLIAVINFELLVKGSFIHLDKFILYFLYIWLP
jgi:hypothetical protein